MNNNTDRLELFALKCAPIKSELERILIDTDESLVQSASANEVDDMIRDYSNQIQLQLRLRAARMGEYYRIFYMLENFIRDFVVDILEEEYGENWWDSRVPERIREGAKSSRERELNAGVTPRSDDMIVYTTFGELMGIMSANWEHFAGMFSSPKGLESVMARLNTLRGPIMHCGVLAEDEVLRLKLSIRDWFKLFDGNALTELRT